MKTQFEFRSSNFPPYEGEEERINPGLWGRRLAEYLVEKLEEKGIATEKMIAEDWGWYIPVQTKDFDSACAADIKMETTMSSYALPIPALRS